MNINELLSRGTEETITKDELAKSLRTKKKLRIYYGVDPSGPVIHLGHALELKILQAFQNLGHKIIFLIGDFTGMIGDPTDRRAARQPLTRKQVLENAKTYKEQVSKFLNFKGKNPAEIVFNSKWNDKFSFKDIIELASHFTVQQFLERDMFQKRIKEEKPISLHEFLYPLVQGNDAAELDADVQIGGTDQKFNMLVSRQFVKELRNKTQIVITLPLLEGTDGRKMSKSFNNVIGVTDDPDDMFGKVMSLKDDLITRYFKLATDVKDSEISKMEKELKKGLNPRDAKLKLAFEIVKIYHGKEKAKKAGQEFEKIFSKRELPTDIPTFKVEAEPAKLVDLICDFKLVSSKSEARRLIKQKAVDVDGTTIFDINEELTPHKDMIIKVGKRKWAKIA